jgi:hypothetical protein
MIYNAWWFEAIMGVLLLNFVKNIKLSTVEKEKWAHFIAAFVMDFISGALAGTLVMKEDDAPVEELLRTSLLR